MKQREEEIRNHETVVSALQEKIKVMKSQLKSLTEVELKAAELAAKLEQFERYNLYVALKILVSFENNFQFLRSVSRGS